MENWHVWTITTNKYKRVIEHLEGLDFIEDFLYPLAEKEYNTKKGRRKRSVPLYSNYMFIKYNRDLTTDFLLQECSWIIQYVGPCSAKEVAEVKELSQTNYKLVTTVDELDPGTKVKMVQTPFAGWDAEVVEQDEDKLLVAIRIFGGERIIKCKMEDINIIE